MAIEAVRTFYLAALRPHGITSSTNSIVSKESSRMRRRSTGAIATCCLLAALSWGIAHSDSQSDAVESARLLALLFDAGRVTVGLNQDVINDPTPSGQAFTGAIFERQVIEEFRRRSGIDLTNLENEAVPTVAKPLLRHLLEDSKKTIDSYAPVLRMTGLRYKGLIPATFGTETASRFQARTGVYLKQTAPDAVLRNPKNKADAYEAAQLEAFRSQGPPPDRSSAVRTEVTDGLFVRVLLPLYYDKACLACHGEPRGERDITGHTKEGAREGDLGGAISVKMPVR